MYVYITSGNRNVHGYNMTKKDVETLVVEHFGVHHKAHKPSPTFGRQWNYLFQEQLISFRVHFWLGGLQAFQNYLIFRLPSSLIFDVSNLLMIIDRYGKKLVKSFSCRLPRRGVRVFPPYPEGIYRGTAPGFMVLTFSGQGADKTRTVD